MPTIVAPSSGSSKPALSRSNHCGPLIAQKISRMIANVAATGSRPLRPRPHGDGPRDDVRANPTTLA